MFDVKSTVIAALIAAAMGAGASWLVQDWRYGAIINENEAKQKSDEAERMRLQLDKVNKLQVERDGLARQIAKLDGDYAGKLKAAEDENKRLNDCLRSGKCGLRVAPGICQRTAAPSVPAPASAPGVDDAGSARLAEDARQDYLNLRSAISAAQLQLRGLQDYIRAIQTRPEQ